MALSARMLGNEVGLTAQEVNFVLNHQGLYDGEPGAWFPTPKGAPHASDFLHERGSGWLDSVRDVVDFSDEAKRRAKQAVVDWCRGTDARNAATASAERARLAAGAVRRAARRPPSPGRAAGTTKAAAALAGLAAAYWLYQARSRRLDEAASRRAEELPPKSAPEVDSESGEDSRGADAT